MKQSTFTLSLLAGAVVGGCQSPDDGSRPGMPPAQESPQAYLERLRKSDLPAEEKQQRIERFQANQRMIEGMKAAYGPKK